MNHPFVVLGQYLDLEVFDRESREHYTLKVELIPFHGHLMFSIKKSEDGPTIQTCIPC